MKCRCIKRWRPLLFLALAIVGASFLLLVSRRPSRWELSLDLANWCIRQTQQIEFAKGGLEVRSRNTHYYGPIAISSVHLWTRQEALPFFGNGLN